MKIGLFGKGYWGKIIQSKIESPMELIFSADSKFKYSDYLKEIKIGIVATPNDTHFDIVEELLLNGIHVWCEKPFTGDDLKSKYLFELADSKKLNLYVNNIFLKRNIYRNFKERIHGIKINKVEFHWYKYGPFSGEIKDDLLYHDLYLLKDLLGIEESPIKLEVESSEINLLKLNGFCSGIKIKFYYNRKFEKGKIKYIKINGKEVCDFSIPDNDPLKESLFEFIFNPEKIDFLQNKQLTISTESLLQSIATVKTER